MTQAVLATLPETGTERVVGTFVTNSTVFAIHRILTAPGEIREFG